MDKKEPREVVKTEKILAGSKSMGIAMTADQAGLLAGFCSFMLQENLLANLTRIVEPHALLWKHLLDSLAPLSYHTGSIAYPFLDLGSGAGFPGIPLCLYLENPPAVLLEANQKKAAYLERALQYLGLTNCKVLAKRAEEAGQKDSREKYPLVVARAVAPLAVLAELALPLVSVGGEFWAYKGLEAREEIKQAGEIIKRCGGTILHLHHIKFPQESGIVSRCIIRLGKEKPALNRYPRRAGIPQKRPLLGLGCINFPKSRK